jgi:hypothetical protein
VDELASDQIRSFPAMLKSFPSPPFFYRFKINT